MRTKQLFARFGTLIDLVGSAAAAASAVEAKRMPRAKDLRTLGIDADAFSAIGKH